MANQNNTKKTSKKQRHFHKRKHPEIFPCQLSVYMKNLAGKRFGRLSVVGLAGKSKAGDAYWNCVCDCGNTNIVKTGVLTSGKARSCGCMISEVARRRKTTHGLSKTKTYAIWQAIIQRSLNKNHAGFHRYGGRGVSVCERWKEFESFYKDMGEQPEGMQIDRINNDKGYEPGNCRWVTPEVNNSNKSTNRLLSLNGETMTITRWAKKYNINSGIISKRLKNGWSLEKAITTPRGKGDKRGVRFEYKGKNLTIREWSDETGLPIGVLRYRLLRGNWDIQNALTTPQQK